MGAAGRGTTGNNRMAEDGNRMIIFLLPTYNEERNVEKLLHNIFEYAKKMKYDYRICLVDDGSTDSTVEKAQELAGDLPIEIIMNGENMGPGAAFDNGFRSIIKDSGDNDIIVTMEADNTSDLMILDSMVKQIKEGADLVLASCYAEGGKIEGTSLFRMMCSGDAR